MPHPPASVSPHLIAPFAIQPRFEMSRTTGDQNNDRKSDVPAAWRRAVSALTETQSKAMPQAPREVLGSVNVNTAPNGSHIRPHSKPSASKLSTLTSIPKPALVPDVFAPLPTDTTTGSVASRPAIISALAGKRTRGSVTASASKRSKVKDERDAVQSHVRDHKAQLKAEEERWSAKWVKVFPTLTFHFEIGAEEGQGKHLSARVHALGGKIDQFFSTRVTHLITKGVNSPQKPRPMAPPTRSGDSFRESPRNPFLDNTGVTDLAQKAEALGIKVWNVKKLKDILARLAPPMGHVAANDSLRTLLEDEKLHGTRERDLSAPRPDHYYFKPGNKYLLVEDATGKHRTIMVKEYQHSQKDTDTYPILYDSFLRVSSAMQTTVPVNQIRQRAWALYVDRQTFDGEQPHGALKRSTSLRSIPGTPKLPAALPYYNASGNSVVITSNTASTSTANNSPAFPSGLPTLGANKDRAIMQMSKRVQVLKGNARLAAAKKECAELDIAIAHQRQDSIGQPPQQKTFMTQEQVVKMLQQARESIEDEGITTEQRIRNREKVEAGLKGKEQDSAPGYCENCRLRYTDLSVHVATKKHRRFAQNDENFEDLDRLLFMLQRPLNPNFSMSDYPPCNDRHGKDDPCEKCDVAMYVCDDEGSNSEGGEGSMREAVSGEEDEYSSGCSGSQQSTRYEESGEGSEDDEAGIEEKEQDDYDD